MRRLTLVERQEAAEFLAQQPAEVLCEAVFAAAARLGTDNLKSPVLLDLCALNCDEVVGRSEKELESNPKNTVAQDNYRFYDDWARAMRMDARRIRQGEMPSMAGGEMIPVRPT